jgi:2-dehydro-3-deoxygluconokinase
MPEVGADPVARREGGPEVLTLGEAMVALVAGEPGPLAENRTFLRHVAGAEANVAVGLSRLGHSSAFIGRVGPDAFGTAIRRRLLGEEVDCSCLAVDPTGPTGILIRERRFAGSAEVLYYRGDSAGSHLSKADVEQAADLGLFGTARWLHLTGITPALSRSALAAVEAARVLARAAGLTVSFDVNLRRKLWSMQEAGRVLAPLAARSDVVFGSPDEVALIAGLEVPAITPDRTSLTAVADATLAMGPRSVVMKLGSGGSLERRRGSDGTAVASHHPGFAVTRVLDPVGAGDGFVAGYIAAALEGLSSERGLALGNACGASVATSVGDLHGLPTRAEAERIMATSWQDALR